MADHCYLIAEAGVNHNGDLQRALAMVDAAADAGADAVKFQTFDPAALASASAPLADYQVRNDGNSGGQLAMLLRLALKREHHAPLLAHCAQRGIDFLSSPFDLGSAQFLIENLNLRRVKLGSGELNNAPLLLLIAHSGRPLILSTGMAEIDEIREALGVLAFGYLGSKDKPTAEAFRAALDCSDGYALLREKVTLLHCTSEYPTPFTDVNLRAMDTLRQEFGLSVGYSDHTVGISIPIAAAARGASVIEKHFTLDRNLTGPDHKASVEPGELRAIVEGVRQVEQAFGDGVKQVAPSETRNRSIARKSLVAAQAIRSGELFSTDNLTCKRPGTGLAPINYWKLLGQAAQRNYVSDEFIDSDEL